jgi:hypothetical protein
MNLKNAVTVLIALLAISLPHLAVAELKKGEWSVSFILKSEAESLEDPYNRLGQRKDAAPGFDQYDLPELDQTWAGTYLSVIFYRPEWGEEKKTYNTDFHPVAKKATDEWTFEVRSNDSARDLSLTWVGENTRMKRMVLVDLQEDKVIPAVVRGKTQVYDFRMNSMVRQFAWRVLTKAQYRDLVASGREKDKAAKKKQRKKSNWLPKGWSQGEGKGHRVDPVAEGLPDDPFGD